MTTLTISHVRSPADLLDVYAALEDMVEQIAVYRMIYGGESCPIGDGKALEAIRQINPCYDPTDKAYWRKLDMMG